MMAIHITPEHEARINELARQTGREIADVLGEVIDSYFEELARINATGSPLRRHHERPGEADLDGVARARMSTADNSGGRDAIPRMG